VKLLDVVEEIKRNRFCAQEPYLRRSALTSKGLGHFGIYDESWCRRNRKTTLKEIWKRVNGQRYYLYSSANVL
jgi:hypothetical protein